jgi:phosphopantothenoylcysteine synthetase/decarboxylase
MGNNMAHIDLTRDADAILIAPATADVMAKLVHGLADDLLTTLCLARDCPLLVAPAMNRQMWEHPATRRNGAAGGRRRDAVRPGCRRAGLRRGRPGADARAGSSARR